MRSAQTLRSRWLSADAILTVLAIFLVLGLPVGWQQMGYHWSWEAAAIAGIESLLEEHCPLSIDDGLRARLESDAREWRECFMENERGDWSYRHGDHGFTVLRWQNSSSLSVTIHCPRVFGRTYEVGVITETLGMKVRTWGGGIN